MRRREFITLLHDKRAAWSPVNNIQIDFNGTWATPIGCNPPPRSAATSLLEVEPISRRHEENRRE